MMKLDTDAEHDENLKRLILDIKADNPDLNNLIDMFKTLPPFKHFEDGDKQPLECIEDLMDLLEEYLSIDNINIEY